MYGTTLKLVMEKESTMVLVDALNYPSKGRDEVYRCSPSRHCIYSEMVCICHGRTSNKETPSAENILGGDKCRLIPNTSSEHSAWNSTVSFN